MKINWDWAPTTKQDNIIRFVGGLAALTFMAAVFTKAGDDGDEDEDTGEAESQG